MTTLLIGDVHVNEKYIEELNVIFEEIMMIDADRVIQLGDFFDHNRPTPKELCFGTGIAYALVDRYKDVTILSGTGSHDILNGHSVIEYLEAIGVNVIKGEYVVDNMLFAHYMLHESRLSHGTSKKGIKDISSYQYCFLGHQHLPETLLEGHIWHLGSIFYQTFAEIGVGKRVALIRDGNVSFVPLKSPLPMKKVGSVLELADIPFKSKVCLEFSSFKQFKEEINELSRWKDKFTEFKYELAFTKDIINDNKVKQTKTKKLTEILQQGIAEIKDEDVRMLLKEELDKLKEDRDE